MTQEIFLCDRHKHGPDCPGWDAERERYNPRGQDRCAYRENEFDRISDDWTELLARYFQIDLEKLEKEKTEILKQIRINNSPLRAEFERRKRLK